MKNFFLFAVLLLTISVSAFAQPLLSEFKKAKDIKVLQSTREDVKRILAKFEHDDETDAYYSQRFSTKNAEVKIILASGDCSEGGEKWNVPEWTVTKIRIKPEDTVELKDFKFDFSKYKKEIEDEEYPEEFNYHDEDAGILFKIDDGEIDEIFIYPPKSKIGFLCNNENTEEIISGESPYSDLIDDEIVCYNRPAQVTNLTLSAEEIVGCYKSDKNCSVEDMKISVTTEALDAENDALVYIYNVSGGKIVGNGEKVIWDLSGVASGSYTITAGVDDGCGICGETKTQTVEVK